MKRWLLTVNDLTIERRRYEAAQSAGELQSVFTATAPVIENILREFLGIVVPGRQFTNLGQMIAVVQQRQIGGLPLLSQLNHILDFGRDLAAHGHQLPEPVIRIACENAFSLATQLGALFPPEPPNKRLKLAARVD